MLIPHEGRGQLFQSSGPIQLVGPVDSEPFHPKELRLIELVVHLILPGILVAQSKERATCKE